MRLPCSIIIVSDRGARGERADETAPGIVELLRGSGFDCEAEPQIVPDERETIGQAIRQAAGWAAVILTSGGTGIAPRDVTPEATGDVIEREIPGFGEAMRAASRATTPFADLSRARAGVIGTAVVVNLPGSPRGARECLEVVLPALGHAVKSLRGAVQDCQEEIREERNRGGSSRS